ncbi:MAG: hypothetical protein ABI620_09355 [Chloroflexota bacterium]
MPETIDPDTEANMSNLIDDTLANPLIGTAATALAIAAVALWIAGAWWAWRDAARRTESTVASFVAAAWVILSTPLLLPLSLAVYAVARPPVTAAEHRAQALVATMTADAASGSTCPGCAGFMDSGWVRCPTCATWLAAPCSSCNEWAPAGLELCPFCGREGHVTPVVDEAIDEAIPALVGATRIPPTPGMARPAAAAARMGVPTQRRVGA